MELILYSFLITSTWLLVKKYNNDFAKKKKLKHYFLLICTGWLVFLTLYLYFSSPSLVNATETRLEFLFFILFVLYNVFFLTCIRRLFNNNYWCFLLLLPATYILFLNILLFNKPSYSGAMEGFAILINFYMMIKILITFPLFIFAFSMTKCHPKIKAIGLFLFVIVTGVLGIQQPIGYEGYLADDTGYMFAVMLLILAAIAAHSFFRNNKIFPSKLL